MTSSQALSFIVNHVVLPPQLPQTEEEPGADRQEGIRALLRLVNESAERFSAALEPEHLEGWKVVKSMLRNFEKVYVAKHSQGMLKQVLNEMVTNDIRIFVLEEQNAALFIQRNEADFVFSCFEISALAEKVTEAEGALVWTFPGRSVSVPKDVLQQDCFMEQLTLFLHRLAHESIPDMRQISVKAESKVREIRNTPSPAMVTELLMAFLAGHGQVAPVLAIKKRIRDERLHLDALQNWRRSPIWTALKVSTQLACMHQYAERHHVPYKNFMCLLVAKVVELGLSASDNLDNTYAATAKLVRRALKLGDSLRPMVQTDVKSAMQRSQKLLEKNWAETQDQHRKTLPSHDWKTWEGMTSLGLEHCNEALNRVMQRDLSASPRREFHPQCDRRLSLSNGLPVVQFVGSDLEIALFDFEQWVAEKLPAREFERSENSLTALLWLLERYTTAARGHYSVHSVQQSIMLLTAVEIWVAMDEIALDLWLVLRDFKPEIPIDFLEPCLLRERDQMRRLREVETYLSARYERATSYSVFDKTSSWSLGVKFFEASQHHQQIRLRIENDARRRWDNKQAEWSRLSADYQRLTAESNALDHSYGENSDGDMFHRSDCLKCQRSNQAQAIKIDKYEWPLPSRETDLKSAVFELDVPAGLGAWRTANWKLAHDLGRGKRSNGPKCEGKLHAFPGLTEFAVRRGERIGFASKTKSFHRSHYRKSSFPVAVESLLLNHGQKYALYDFEQQCWVDDQVDKPDISRFCRTQLPRGPYSYLQYAVDGTNHAPNKVIATQNDAVDLDLHEHHAFASLRAGQSLQWLQISQALATPDLSLDKAETNILILQAAYQAGPPRETDPLRQAHRILADGKFVDSLLTNIEHRFDSVRANWKEGNTLLTLVSLTLRIRSLAPTCDLSDRATWMLQAMRYAALAWTRELNGLRQSDKSGSDTTLRNHLLRAALASKATFDGDGLLTPDNETDVACFIETAIYLHDNSPVHASDLPADLSRLSSQDRRLSHALEPVISKAAKHFSSGVNEGVWSYWKRFPKGQSWSCLPEPNQRWISTSITASSNSATVYVHLNVLNGELLVNGSPLGRLPSTITAHQLYRRVFGQLNPQVMIADIPGLDYVTAAPIHRQYVYFSRRGEELIVQARTPENTYELLPHALFSQDLPACLVNDSTHWINIQQKSIEVRPLDDAWTTSSDNWKLCNRHGRWEAHRHAERLVSSSATFYKDVVSVMEPIEEAKHIVVTTSGPNLLQASLPRYCLRFFVNAAQELECRERRAVVDCNQEVGSFIGLRNYLVLRNTGPATKTFKRQLIVPRGKVSVTASGKHVAVSVDTGTKNTVPHATFIIDTILNRIQANGVLNGLFKTYLHALTASVLPDPLTGRTGTEEALSYLRNVHLLEPPNAEITGMLENIQMLSPQRSYYPLYLRNMQRIMWHSQLSPYCQHEDFEVLAKQIHDKAKRLTVFHGGLKQETCMQDRSSSALITRAAIRNVAFRTQTYGGEVQARARDVTYQSRDRGDWSERSTSVFELSSLLQSWKLETALFDNLPAFIQAFGTVSGFHSDFSVYGPVLLSDLLKLELSSRWGSIFNMCRKTGRSESPRVAFLLSILAFGGADIHHLKMLACIAISEAFSKDSNLSDNAFQNYRGTKPGIEFLGTIKTFTNVTALSKKQRKVPTLVQEHDRKYALAQQQSEAVHKHLLGQWPTSCPSMPTFSLSCMNTTPLFKMCKDNFRIWHANKMLVEYLERIQQTLTGIIRPVPFLRCLGRCKKGKVARIQTWNWPFPSFDPRDCKQHSSLAPQSHMYKPRSRPITTTSEITDLGQLLSSLQHPDSEYIDDLCASLESYKCSTAYETPSQIPIALEALQQNHQAWKKLIRQRIHDFTQAYRKQLKPESLSDAWTFGLRITIDEILKGMRLSSSGESYLRTILPFASEVTSLQRCQRMITLAENQDISNFVEEAKHGDQRQWDIQRFPEWLALEIENDIAIRPLQARVAQEMIAPSSGKNSTMQLNMGEGKSAVIVHMVAATLANKKQLCRILILKPLMRQMMDLLAKRHQGIANRQLYHIPFSRKTPMSSALLGKMVALWMECRESGGILLVQPEHMLSFMLMGIERISSDPSLGRQIFEAHKCHRQMSRDVLDESDEILSTTFQLVYAIGTQKHLEGHPDRWLCQASLLDRVEDALKSNHVNGLTSHSYHDGSFPRITFTRKSAGEALLHDIIPRLMVSGAPRLTFDTLDIRVREAVVKFLMDPDISETNWMLINCCFDGLTLPNLLLLRGLLAGGILLHGLQAKRWLVNYGLDLSRSKLAVPYKAKRVPSPRSEFGHPDVGILFTYLSYYYTGLNESQLKNAFNMLYRSPDPSQEYISWARRSSKLPSDLRDLRGVNLEDPTQFSLQLMPALQYNKKAIDFYLSQVVFPSEAKEFSQKLSTSAWDIPAEPNSPVTTGFSGTNDNKSLLPKSIRQEDLNELRGTNAMVMCYLLQPKNRTCLRLRRSDGQSPDLADLIRVLLDQPQRPQVLIDVGALIIETGNEEVAIEWLRREPDMEAALFFDPNDEMIVIDRNGRKELFQSSPYKDCPDKCLFYLDEYHTRGTDLKLPPNARAAVTISPWLTKDRLVQACMRMRRLADGQSLFFVINEEVMTSISESFSDAKQRDIDSQDVLRFCLLRTCADNERLRPLWAAFGIGHRLRHRAASVYHASTKSASDDEKLLCGTLESDARSLMQLYAPSVAQARGWRDSLLRQDGETDALIRELRECIEKLPKGLAEKSCFSEEQEREVDQEVQREEEKQRPPNLEPHRHAISQGLLEFVRTGHLPLQCQIVEGGTSVGRTSFSNCMPAKMFSSLHVTRDFLNTVQLSANDTSDYYLAPPSFVLTSQLDSRVVLISPFEADQLFWKIYASLNVSLRLYAPRSMKSMRGFDGVGLHTFGGHPSFAAEPWTTEQRRSLNIFAGQLYFNSLEEYNALRKHFSELRKTSEGSEEPVKFLSLLAAVRRKGKPFEATHMGKLINGRSMTVEEV